MLNFVHTTSEVLKEEIPHIFIKSIDYEKREGLFIMRIRFFDLDFNIVGCDFMYSIKPRLLTGEDILKMEFKNCINEHIAPVLKLKGN